MTRRLKLSLLMFSALVFFNCSTDNDDNSPQPQVTTVTDADGNVYNAITIGSQTWTLENLKTTTYNDGSPITEWVFGDDWGSLPDQQAYYQWASTFDLNNIVDEELPFDYYGAHYNHFAIETGKLAPAGWRIPSKQDFQILEAYLNANGFSGNAALALKSDSGWTNSSGNGTDALGFTALPNGYVSAGGTATASELVCSWITTDVEDGPINSSLKRGWVQLHGESSMLFPETPIVLGAGIRLIKNN